MTTAMRDRVRGLIRQVYLLRKHNREMVNLCDHYREMLGHAHQERREGRHVCTYPRCPESR